MMAGARADASAGYWFDPGHRAGIEANVSGLERASTGFSADPAAVKSTKSRIKGNSLHKSRKTFEGSVVPDAGS